MANDAGIEAISGPRDYDKVKRDLKEAGYRGETIVVLGVSGNSYNVPISLVGSDELRKAGMSVDLQVMDMGTLVRRRMSKEPPDKGGWNVFFTILDGLFNDTPATNYAIRGDSKSGLEGWPTSPKLEALREDWLDSARRRYPEADCCADAVTDVAGRALHPNGTLGSSYRASAQHCGPTVGILRILWGAESSDLRPP